MNKKKIFFACTALAITLITTLVAFSACATVNRSALREAIERDVDENSYTTASFEAYQVALQAARTVYQDPGTTRTNVREATLALNRAFNSLIPRADFSRLRELLALEFDFALYSTNSANALISARQTATNIYNNTAARQSQIDAAVQTLETAISRLQPIGGSDRVQLGALIHEHENRGSGNYTTRSFGAFTETLAIVRVIYDDNNSSPQLLSMALNDLRHSIQALEVRGNLNPLSEAKARVKEQATPPDGSRAADFFTQASLAVFEAAMQDAVAMANANDSTQHEISAMILRLEAAADWLVVWDNRAELEDAIALFGQYQGNEAMYTSASFARLRQAVVVAEILLEATPNGAQMAAARQQILDAIENLELIIVQEPESSDEHQENRSLWQRIFRIR